MAALPLFLAACLLSPAPVFAGWLVWQSPRITPPPENETAKTVGEILKSLPENAVKPDGTVSKPVNVLFIARQKKIREIMKKAGWAESAQGMLEFIGGALMNLSSGKNPAKCPPVSKLYVIGKQHDMSFTVSKSSGNKTGIRRGGMDIIRIWRLPYSVSSPAHIPAWCAAVTAEKGLDSFKSTVEKVLAPEKSKVYFRQRQTSLRLVMPGLVFITSVSPVKERSLANSTR